MNWTAVCRKDGGGEPGSEGRWEAVPGIWACANAAEYQEYVRIDSLVTNPSFPGI